MEFESESALLSPNISTQLSPNWTFSIENCTFTEITGLESINNLLADSGCFRHNKERTLFLCVIYALIFVSGLVGNSIVICVVAWKPRMRTATNLYIFNLAVADLFVILFCVPATLLATIFNPWILGNILCKAIAFIQGVSIFASVYSLVAVSIDRCRKIYRPINFSDANSKRRVLLNVIGIWLTAGFITTPYLFAFEIIYATETGPLPYCYEAWRNPTLGQAYFVLVHLLICYCLPMLLIVVLNYIIWKSVKLRRLRNCGDRSGSVQTAEEMQNVRKINILKMLTCLSLAFFLCWLPLYVVMTRIKVFGAPELNPDGSETWEGQLVEIVIPLSQLMGTCNSCLNPLLYAFLSRRFQQSLRSIFSSWGNSCQCKTGRVQVHRTSTRIARHSQNYPQNYPAALNIPSVSRSSRRRRRHTSGLTSESSSPSTFVEIPLRNLARLGYPRTQSCTSVATTQLTLQGSVLGAHAEHEQASRICTKL